MKMIVVSVIAFILLNCKPSPEGTDINNSNINNIDSSSIIGNYTTYDFNKASKVFKLDRQLREVSGLAYNAKDNTFLTINDEAGYYFSLNPIDFQIISSVKFNKKGDYECISIVDEKIIIGKSNGKFYFYNSDDKTTTTHNTSLSTRNDVEGLCYDKSINSLLIACKGQPLDNENSKKRKCIYKFDLDTYKFMEEPFLEIHDKDLTSFVASRSSTYTKTKLKKLKNRAKEFSPSGIAIHPENGDYYITSAKGSSLLIVDHKKNIKDLVFLNKKKNPQPEGICFDTDKNLYISSEGQGFHGKVFKYNHN